MTKLDSNAAWKDATALVAANRDLFLILAGVFFFVPSLAMSIVAGEPDLAEGATSEQAMEAATAFYADHWWLFLLVAVAQIVGVLALLALMRDRRRPTVGEAIRAGGAGLLPYLAAQLIFGLAMGLLSMVLLGVVAAAGAPALVAVAIVSLVAIAVVIGVRLVLVAPVVALEGERNPLAALRRSWALTRGNAWRILFFLALVLVLFLVMLIVVMIVVGLLLALLSSGEVQQALDATVSGALTAVAMVYFVGIIAAIHRQLAGPDPASVGATFE